MPEVTITITAASHIKKTLHKKTLYSQALYTYINGLEWIIIYILNSPYS